MRAVRGIPSVGVPPESDLRTQADETILQLQEINRQLMIWHRVEMQDYLFVALRRALGRKRQP
jgi:hypothetical protein